jgi:hypothetical protein
MVARLVQIYYKDEQKAACYPFADLYFNNGLTIFFENEIIRKLVLASTDEKIGVCSWKLKQKMIYNVLRPRTLTQEVIETEYDVLCFTGNSKNHGMLQCLNAWHPGALNTMKVILEMIGKKMPGEVKRPIYQNSFMAKLEIYQDYVKNWLAPIMDLTMSDPIVYSLMTQDSKYSNLAKKDAASPEYLQEKIGMPFYPLAPFILERLFSIYCHNNRINVTQL